MLGKIALEEHFATEDMLRDSEGLVPDDQWPELRSRILDLHDRRLRLMDELGIELTILSLTSPGVQGVADPKAAIELARRLNDFLADQVARRPDRFQAFAALPMHSPDVAIAELERCVTDLGFRGALVNGFQDAPGDGPNIYFDVPAFRPFWAALERLDVPFYLHPRNPLPRDGGIYQGHPWLLGPGWAFGQETAVHALRLMGSGLFDDHPRINIILGHLGDGLPFNMWRIDHHNAWAWVQNPKPQPARHSFGHYFQNNFFLTTSGNFHTSVLAFTMMAVGADRIMFATDWPYENMDHAAVWFDAAAIAEADRLKIGRGNAQKLFKL